MGIAIFTNYLPVTGYDETAGIQFVDRLMFPQPKRPKLPTKQNWMLRQISLATAITMSLLMIYHFVSNILQLFKFEPIFIAAKIQDKKIPSWY